MKYLSLVYHFLSLVIFLCLSVDLYSQNIGIGTNAITRVRLEVQGVAGSGNTNAIFGGEGTGISFQRNWPTIGFNQYRDNVAGNGRYMANGFAAIQYFDPSTGNMYLDMFPNGSANALTPAGIRAFSIGNTGNIAIKTTPANASLYTVKAGNFDGAAVFGGTSYNSFFNYGVEEHTYIRGGRSGSNIYINDIPGNVILGGGSTMVGINSANPTTTLEVVQLNNRGFILVDPTFNNNYWEYRVGFLYSAPQSDLRMYYNGFAKGYFSADDGEYRRIESDARIKTNIKPLPSVLDRLNLLRPSVYEMKDHNDNHEKTFGFIAQDVKPLFPELVTVRQITVDSVNTIPDLHALNYKNFTVIALKALQEQYLQIKALQKESDELMKRLEELDKKTQSPL